MSKAKLLLEYLVSNPNIFIKALPVLQPEYFDKDLSLAVAYILDYRDEYQLLPTPEMIEAEVSVKLSLKDDAVEREPWVLDEIEKHCRLQAVIHAIHNASDKIGNNDFGNIVEMMKKAVGVSLHQELGTIYFENPRERISRIVANSIMPTGLKTIDDVLGGGIERGGLNIVAANSGGGKSFWLLNMALNAMERGETVAYISLELSEDLICKRMDSMLSGYPAREIKENVDDVASRIITVSKTHGPLYIKYLPTQVTTTRHIETWLKELTTITGKIPDLVLIDYLDLIGVEDKSVSLSDAFTKDKIVSESLRALLMELKTGGWTASQLNRGAVQTEQHEQDAIAGGISKINTSDNTITMSRSQKLREQGMMKITFLKTRSSEGQGRFVHLGVNPVTMRLYDLEEQKEKRTAKPINSRTDQIRERLSKIS